LAWKIKLDPRAAKELHRLDLEQARRITRFLSERIAPLKNPRSIGEALKGTQPAPLWRYRVGDYRIICHIEDDALVVLALRIGHRREVYRNL
jgi:mRNA interferase RelE/StbE